MCRSKYLLSILILLSACTKPDTKPDGVNGNQSTEGTASFRIVSIEGDGTFLKVPTTVQDPTTNLATASVWRIPREVSYTFNACIEDRSTGKGANGHQFAVEIPGTRQRVADVPPTVGKGCFSWHESIPFSYYVRRSKWITIERDIIGTGIHTGRQRVKLAVNPWAVGGGGRDSGDTFRFLRDKPLHPSMLTPVEQANEALSGEALGEDKLYIGDVDIQNIRTGEQNTGTLMRMNITMKPKIRFESQDGVPVYRPILDGDFYVIAHLVLNNTGPKLNERVILSSAGENSELQKKYKAIGIVGTGRVIDGKLIAHVSAWVHGRMPQGNLELVLKVIPKGIRGLSPAEGIYELGAFRNLSSSFSGDLNKNCREDGPCDIASYLKGATNFDDMRKIKYGADNSPYLFDRLNLRFMQVEPGETTTQRTVTYTASTCITDAFTGERPVGLPFLIEYKETGERIEDQKTGEDGCLRWNSTIFHKYYHPEEFIERNVVISKDSGFHRDMRFYINPWDDKFTFGFDEREFKKSFWDTLKGRKKIPSRFFLADFGYHTVRFQYNIDSLMSLEVRKTVLMELDPRVLRYSGIINARKMTEPLRDGIWYMKVGIQKNYLDPAQIGVHIDALKESQNGAATAAPGSAEKGMRIDGVPDDSRDARNRLRKLGIDVPQREFISTQKALVRTTDGVIIQPVEFTMQDLRMMRVRSNFLIELQPVDERKLQVENKLRGNFGEYMDTLAKERKAKNDLLGKNTAANIDPAKLIAEEDKRLDEQIEKRRKGTRDLFTLIASELKTGNGGSGVSFEEMKISPEQLSYFPKDQQDLLNDSLATNDFTTIKLPPCTEIDCDAFVEQGATPDDLSKNGPGLIRRTFVGPVIFLSNGYKDSVRATDNLDEAKCDQKVQFQDERERELDEFRRNLFASNEVVTAKKRENTLYKFSEYFGSLRHLCYSHVDDLIEREDKFHFIYEKNIPAVGSVYNFTQAYGMNFLSLVDEKPKSVSFDANTFARCNNDLTQCMRETTENWIPSAKAVTWINAHLHLANNQFVQFKNWVVGNNSQWTVRDLRTAIFGKRDEERRLYAACVLVAGSFADSLLKNGVKVGRFDTLTLQPQIKSAHRLADEIIEKCVSFRIPPVVFDQKLRVFKTGQADDSYVFLGGYQMNINVGQSFSVGRSSGYSFGVGLEGTDFVGSAGGVAGSLGRLASTASAVGGALTKASNVIAPITSVLKPLSIKAGWSTGLSQSDGTSISESTYLVAQIAKFRVRLDEYERCYALSFTPAFVKSLAPWGVIDYDPLKHGAARTIFMCEGQKITQPRFVDEMYFYFTQHFTEGDMLDQADLYNHPWLLALRGYRDFGSFISLIRKQDGISFWEMAKGMVSPQERTVDWPLSHMRDAYKKIVPSFPGFYTVLDESEGLTQFPLEMTKTDMDMNFEVRSKERRLDLQRNTN